MTRGTAGRSASATSISSKHVEANAGGDSRPAANCTASQRHLKINDALSLALRRLLVLLCRLGDGALLLPVLQNCLLFVRAGVEARELLERVQGAIRGIDAALVGPAVRLLRRGRRFRLCLRLALRLRLCLGLLAAVSTLPLDVDGLVAFRAVSDGDDLRPCEVLDDVQQIADRLRQLDRRFPVHPPLGLREDRRLPPTANLLDDGVAVVQDRLRRQLLARLDDRAVLEDPPVRDHALALRVGEDVGDAHAVLVVVISPIEGADGAVGALRGHGLGMQDAVEEADDAGAPACHAELAVRRVDAAGRRHRNTEVVGAL
mmetsp:Transcript_88834/g.248656  ORF Transcript_88834/g.248656 Transcript_88834/m.248656 type:complete len:317 (-) Transcript_88834:1485-2435(-)